MAASVAQVSFIIASVFFALLIFLLAVILSRATLVRWIFGRIGRLTRRGSLRGRHAATQLASQGEGIVGTSGYAAVKRFWSQKSYTERALDRVDRQDETVEETINEVLEKYVPAQEEGEGNLDEYASAFPGLVEEHWKAKKGEILRPYRTALFEKNKRGLVLRFGKEPGEIIKDEYLPPAGLAGIGKNAGNSGQILLDGKLVDLTEDVLTFDMVDFDDKHPFTDLSEHDEERIVAEGAFEKFAGALHKRGMVFQEIRATANYLPDHREIEYKMAQRNYFKSTFFFLHDITVDDDADLLYEDINDAAIVQMIGVSDRRTLYYLTQWRKVVNRNVFILSFVLSAILAIVLCLNYLYGYAVTFTDENGEFSTVAKMMSLGGPESPAWAWIDQIGVPFAVANKELIIIALCKWGVAIVTILLSYWTSLFIFRFPYTHFQRVNNTELVAFIRGKTSRLSRDFYRAESFARGAFSGDRMSATSGEVAKIWFINMQWIALRLYHVELFLRSVLYQVKRNSGYYVLGIPALFLLPILFAIMTIFVFNMTVAPEADVMGAMANYSGQIGRWLFCNLPFVLLFIWLSYFVIGRRYLARCVQELLDVDDTGWQNFHEFNVQRLSAGLVRHYVGEIYNERMRVRGGGGGR